MNVIEIRFLHRRRESSSKWLPRVDVRDDSSIDVDFEVVLIESRVWFAIRPVEAG
jgi:hypothetical protein